MNRSWNQKSLYLFSALLIGVVLVIYGQTINHDFVYWDDKDYFLDHPQVREGLSLANIEWAFTSFSVANWHPLSWISMMTDVSLFGLWAGGHHIVGMIWHTANSLLLFVLLIRFTNDQNRSFVVALLFAIHPLHVESVAWAAERKDLICAFFWLTTIWFWHRYTLAPNYKRYLWVVISMVMALLAKPMAITLPAILLLIDFWPLKRHENHSLRILIMEKVPLGIISLCSMFVTILAQSSLAIRSVEEVGLLQRLWDVINGYATYMVKTIFPLNSSFFYVRYPIETMWLAGSALLLLASIFIAIKLRKKSPFIIFGLGWFFIALLPVIGIVSIGDHAWANRYSYLPHIGLFIALVWAFPIPEFVKRRPLLLPSSLLILSLIMISAAVQETAYWKNSETLFNRALKLDPNNYIAHSQLAVFYLDHGGATKALHHITAALNILPKDSNKRVAQLITHSRALMALNRFTEAKQSLNEALRYAPKVGLIHYNLGTLALLQRNPSSALSHLNEAIHYSPNDSKSHSNLGVALLYLGRYQEAYEAQKRAVEIYSGNLDARYNLALVLDRLGHKNEALFELETVAEYDPKNIPARRHASRLARSLGDNDRALYWSEQVNSLTSVQK